MSQKPRKVIIKERGKKVQAIEVKEIERVIEEKRFSVPKKFQKISLAGQIVLYEPDPQVGKMVDIDFKKEVFCRWFVLPRTKREPQSHGELCNRLGIDISTPYLWLQNSQVQSMIEQYRREYFKRDTTNVIQDLRKRIRKLGRAQDAKLWLEYIEGWIPQEAQIQDQQINVIFRGIERPKPANAPLTPDNDKQPLNSPGLLGMGSGSDKDQTG